jgi:hypothetical protein
VEQSTLAAVRAQQVGSEIVLQMVDWRLDGGIAHAEDRSQNTTAVFMVTSSNEVDNANFS